MARIGDGEASVYMSLNMHGKTRVPFDFMYMLLGGGGGTQKIGF